MRSTDRNVPISTIGRVSAVLDCFTLQEPVLSMTELSRRTGLAKSTMSRLSRELIDHGFLEHHGKDLTLGLRFFELGEQTSRPRNLRQLAWARMEELRHRTGNTVHLAVLDGQHVVYIEILRSRTTPKLPSRVGGRVPAFATAVGKVMMAFSPPEIADGILGRGMWKIGPNTITDPAVLRAELERVREAGFATEEEESGPGTCCVAAPLTVRGDELVAAVSVTGRVGEMDLGACTRAVVAATRRLRQEAELLPRQAQVL